MVPGCGGTGRHLHLLRDGGAAGITPRRALRPARQQVPALCTSVSWLCFACCNSVTVEGRGDERSSHLCDSVCSNSDLDPKARPIGDPSIALSKSICGRTNSERQLLTTCRWRSRSPESVDAARDKSETRAFMARTGLPTPRNMLIEKPEQVEQAGLHVGFPAGEVEQNCGMLTSPLRYWSSRGLTHRQQ